MQWRGFDLFHRDFTSTKTTDWGLPGADFDHRWSCLDTTGSVFGFTGRYAYPLNGYGAQYDKQVDVLPKHLDEMLARLQLEKIGAKLTELSAKQAAYINEPVEGPDKLGQDRF